VIGYDYGNLWEWEEFDAPRLLEVMADFNAPWWVAGGWALDLWMERESRPHHDVDIAILRGDQQKLYRSLSRWELYYATPDHKLLPLSPERWLRPPIHGVWVRRAHDAPWLCEFLLNEHTGSEWMYRVVEPGVAARLDKGAVYGLWTWNTRKTTRRKVWDETAGEFKIRYNYAPRPREEWLVVPMPDAGVPREVVEAARQSLKDNVRKPSKAAKRFWELSEGILRCGECGHTLRPNTSHKKSGRRFHYYSCRSRYNTGPSRDCGNRKYLRAEQLEEQVWEFVYRLLRDPERIRVGLDRLIEEERTNAGWDPERDAEFWSRKITEAEVERRGYHRLAVKGHMTDEELAAALSELDEVRETAKRKLEAARARGEALKRLELDRDALMESYAGMVRESLENLASEERHRIYKLLRLGVRFRPDWPLEITGVFSEVGEEAEMGSSKCKLRPLSV